MITISGSMGRFSRYLFLVFLTSLCAAGARSQWTLTSTPILGPNKASNGGGAMQYCDGVVWAAHQSLLRSDDTGLTWRTIETPFIEQGEYITSIHFVNRLVGVITSHSNCGYTTDGGFSWSSSHTLGAQSGLLFPDGRTIAIVDQKRNAVLLSTDAGGTWTSHPVANFPSDIVQSRDGSLYVLAGYDVTSYVMQSSDGGLTFDTTRSGFTGDSWSLALDSCNGMFAVNEDYWALNEQNCHIYRSTDRGASWVTSYSSGVPDLNGSICTSPAAVYAQTVQDGVVETTDQGTSWHSIEGPSENVDARCICAVQGKYVIASDSTGYLWRYKTNFIATTSGPLSVQPTRLFVQDTISACDSIERTIIISTTPCTNTHLISADITGPNRTHYQIRGVLPSTLSGIDTIHIIFKSGAVRDYVAELVLSFDNDTTRHIDLRGTGNSIFGGLSYSPSSLFDGVELSACDTPHVGIFWITDSACIHRHVISQKISGPAAQDYLLKRPLAATLGQLDSAIITFFPKTNGTSAAQYELLLDDSTRITIPLSGVGITAKSYAFLTNKQLFEHDTLTNCMSPVVRDIALEDSGCQIHSVDSLWIEGRDALAYQIVQTFPTILTGHDTARVSFTCNGIGDFLATLKMRLSDGTVLQLPFSAYGVTPIFRSARAIYDDTIGTDIEIPITFNMRRLPWDLAIRVRYDTTMLEYRATYTSDNTDVGKLLRPGYIEIHVPKDTYADDANIIARTHFDFYPLADSCTTLTIDSFKVGDGHCSIVVSPLFDTICSTLTARCIPPYITQLMRWPPIMLRIQPNPVATSVLLHTSVDLEDAEIIITDALGKVCLEKRASLSSTTPYALSVEGLPSGLLGLQVRCGPQRVRMSLLHVK